MADNEDSNDKKKKKSIIASLDLKNYKAKYTDSYGLGKPNEIDLDNFLVAEPDPKSEDKKEPEKIMEKKTPNIEAKVNVAPTVSNTANKINQSELVVDKNNVKKTSLNSNDLPVRDSDFERRVNAEADNDFYDDKPIQQIGDTFRSDVLKRRPVNEDNFNSTGSDNSIETKPNRKINLREPVKVNVRHEIGERFDGIEVDVPEKKPIRRTETYGIIISAVAFIYSIFTKDKPLLFLSVSLLLYLMRPIIAAPFGKYSHSVQNAIKGFSMALFFGSIFFIFF
ncbi:MAG: hypothetical protein IJ862_07035 [Selenomonadaceae bacterium]|nr:hypothetical protein [Selenomonadaceae bacterium]